MKVRNTFGLAECQLYYCFDEKIHDFLHNKKEISYINTKIENGKLCYVYFKSVLLLNALEELGNS